MGRTLRAERRTRRASIGMNGADPLKGRRVVLDCRLLGMGGAGRVTELLLGHFQVDPPPGEWVLWGRAEQLEALRFPGAAVAAWSGDPRTLFGQRDVFRVPRGDVVLYAHQIRPLRPGRSVTIIHDTIPLRHGGTATRRLLKRLFFLAVARASDEVLTDSEFSRGCIERDLHVPRERIWVMTFPSDPDRAAAIARLRDELGQDDRILYLGRFAPHKNLERLCHAFAASDFAGRGGTLLLVGGWDDEADRLRAWVAAQRIAGVEVRPSCPEDEVDRLLATSRALVLPSLEEGFGLPAFEAAASGLPVAASRTGAMTMLTPEQASLFDPLDVDAMRQALDTAASRPARGAAPMETSFAGVVLDALRSALADQRRTAVSARV